MRCGEGLAEEEELPEPDDDDDDDDPVDDPEDEEEDSEADRARFLRLSDMLCGRPTCSSQG